MDEVQFSPEDFRRLRRLFGLKPGDRLPRASVLVDTFSEWKNFHDELKAQLAGKKRKKASSSVLTF